MDKGLILIVDDDQEILEISSEVLLEKGFEVIAMDDPLAALNLLAQGKKFDVIITDFRMPEMNGLELMARIKTAKIETPVIMFTGVADKELAVQALNSGCQFLLEKPLRNHELIHYTEQALIFGRLEIISEQLLQECNRLIGLLQDLSESYETRYTHAENRVYQSQGHSSFQPTEVQDYLKNISRGTSIEAEIQIANQTVQTLSEQHQILKSRLGHEMKFS